MNSEHALTLAKWCWFLWAAIWFVLMFWHKRVKQRETADERIRHIAPMLIGFWLLFGRVRSTSWFERIVISQTPAVLWSGLALTALGVLISVWARLVLGSNWSGVVTLKENHELIRNGPYRWIRHPIYTGILVSFAGTAIVDGRLRGWLGLAIVWVTFYFKARREEQFLRQEFGDRFEQHKRKTGMFLPKFS
jgi:protein-S-isoprenylcysteine O-methyltransferase Ste14